MVILSVSKSMTTSSRWTKSPSFLRQAATTPLVTDSPTGGITISVAIASSRELVLRAGGERPDGLGNDLFLLGLVHGLGADGGAGRSLAPDVGKGGLAVGHPEHVGD